MATLDQLYARIILDTNRDDMGSGGELEQAKVDAVADAIALHAGELFWFNRASGTVTTVAGAATAALPTGMRIAAIVSWQGAPLRKVALEAIERAYDAASPATGLPSLWAEDAGALHFFPTPDAAYTLSVYGLAELGVPGSGGAANAWTTEAHELILNEAKIILCRGALRDADGLALARDGRVEALARLRRETRRRGATAAASDLPAPAAYDIRTG